MKKEREFLSELYKNRIESIPFIEYFQNDRYFRNSLFETYKFNRQAFLDISLFKALNEVSKEIEDFRNTVLKETNISLLEYADNFAKSIIYKLESTRLPKLTKRILNDFVNEVENIDLQAAYVIEFNNHSFQKEYGVTIKEAERKYRELKRYANNHIASYLKELDEKENTLLNKFKGIGYLDYKSIIKELSKYETISQKLDYLKIIKQEYHDKYEEIKKTISEEEYILFHNNYTTVYESIFGNCSLITPLQIQEPVHKYYFKNGLNIPEYTYWFLKYNSEYAFNWYINRKEFKSQVNSKLKDTFIKAELKQLNDFEERAKELLLNKELDIYKPHRNNYNCNKEIVLLRVLDGNYYKENTTYTINGLGSDEVQVYFKHILLKPYLENLLKGNVSNPKIKSAIDISNFGKEYFISKIRDAEDLAKQTVELSFKQDMFDLEQKKIDGEHYKLLLSEYLTNTINSYHKLRNLYKASKEQFYFLNDQAQNNLTEIDRLDFIATVLVGYLETEAETKEEIETKLDAIQQMQDIHNIVYETYLLELKSKTSKEWINKIKIEVNNKKKNDINLTVYERVMRELNVVAWAFECQFMEASTSVIETPMLQSKGRYMAGMYHITSNIEMIQLQDYIQHYTERFETTSNTVLVNNELLSIYEKATNILEYYNKNLTSNSEIVKQFHENKPQEFNEQQDYFKEHSGIIVVQDLQPQHIVFGMDFNSNEAQWTHNEYNYPTTHNQLALFCEKLIDFINKFDIKNDNTSIDIQQSDKSFSHAEKLEIALELIGDNETSYTSIVYHHIKDVLNNKGLTYLQGRDILLDMKGAFSPEQNKIIIEPIITYLERINSSNNSVQINSRNNKKTKTPAKYYALYHWILISLGAESHFERNENDKYSKTEIESFAKERYSEVSSQMFYRSFIEIDITNTTMIANSFGKDYKDKVISISNNDAKVITKLKSFPN
jgi:hypothetical protein